MSKEIKIRIPDGKTAEWVNGVLTLVDEKKTDNRPVTERIRTFEDACKELGEDNALVLHYRNIIKENEEKDISMTDIVAYLKLRIITAALNEGWEPLFKEDESRFHPCFDLCNKEEFDELFKIQHFSFFRCTNPNTTHCVMFYNKDIVVDKSLANCDFRLVFWNADLAKYAGEQFFDLWADFLFKPGATTEINRDKYNSWK